LDVERKVSRRDLWPELAWAAHFGLFLVAGSSDRGDLRSTACRVIQGDAAD